MVRIVNNNAVRRCICENCKSVLEYSDADKEFVQVGPREKAYKILCPACGNYTAAPDQMETYIIEEMK